MINIPNGNVTFLFTDIEGSTKLSQDYPDIYPELLTKHNSILQNAVESNDGFVFKTVGDAFCCAFQNAEDAVKAAVGAQIIFSSEKTDELQIKVRVGIHSGRSEWSGTDYMGYMTLARSARVMSSAYGEQIIISDDTYQLLPKTFLQKEEISFRDLGERRLKDVIQPIRLYQINCTGLREDFPPLKTLDARPNNLPVQLTGFIGREDSLKIIKELLEKTRLLTLLGPGGGGKTRLAMQVGADMIDDFANGVFIAELAPVTDPDFIPDTLLNSFGIKEEARKTDEATLTDHLKNKELLLILDNCEHLIYECAVITEKLLSSCPKLRIITTSRESLNCSGERTYSVPSLSHPDISNDISPQQLSQFESVRLFIERALAVNLNFRITNENVKALAEICSRLDGIPLAIELAAARVKALSVEKICERLHDRFSLLTGGRRTALPRQQTLKALIDWSFDLLSDKEKILWERLSVFTGGWTLESAEEICSDEKIKVAEILDLLNALTEKSILIYDIDKERYLILETLKQYGEEKLRDSGGKIDILSKHLHYFMEYAEAAELKLKGDESKEQLDRLENDHGNIQSAIIWAAEGGDKEEGARLAGALHIFWAIRGHCSIGTILLESILNKIQNVSKSSLGKVLNSISNLALEQSDYEKAQKYSEKNLSLSREIDDKPGVGKSLTMLGHVALCQGNYEQAQKYYEESLSLSRETEDKIAIVFCLLNLGEIAFSQGNYEESKKFFEEGLILSRETGDKRSIAISLLNQGNLAFIQDDYIQAQKFSEESMILCREIGYKRGIGNSFHSLGCAAHHQGNYEQAMEHYEESILLFRETGNKRGIGVSFHSMGCAALTQKNHEQAQKYLEEAVSIFREIGDKECIAFSLIGFAGILSAADLHSQAVKLLGAADETLRPMSAVLDRMDQMIKEQTEKELHNKISDEEFEKYFEEGKKLTLEEAWQLVVNS